LLYFIHLLVNPLNFKDFTACKSLRAESSPVTLVWSSASSWSKCDVFNSFSPDVDKSQHEGPSAEGD